MSSEGILISHVVLKALGILAGFHIFAEVINVFENNSRRIKYARLPSAMRTAAKKSYKALKNYLSACGFNADHNRRDDA